MKFNELDLHEDIMQGLDAMNFEEMTPVQEQTIPVILSGQDLIGCAQTGTGKTAAYTLPLLDKLAHTGNPDNVIKALIIVPTRELAQQIDIQFQGFAYFLPVSTTVVYGGGDGIGWSQQKQGMVMGSDIVIAAPGRLLSFLNNSSDIDLSHVEYFVLDEADRMLDMGFFDDIMKIIAHLPAQRQNILFSATLPPKIREMAKQIMHNPAEVTIAVSKPNRPIRLYLLRIPKNRTDTRTFLRSGNDQNNYFRLLQTESKRVGTYPETDEDERRGHALRSGTTRTGESDARL